MPNKSSVWWKRAMMFGVVKAVDNMVRTCGVLC